MVEIDRRSFVPFLNMKNRPEALFKFYRNRTKMGLHRKMSHFLNMKNRPEALFERSGNRTRNESS